MSKTYKETCKYLNHVENFLILVWTVTNCVSISEFSSLVCVPVVLRVLQWEKMFAQPLQECKSMNQL